MQFSIKPAPKRRGPAAFEARELPPGPSPRPPSAAGVCCGCLLQAGPVELHRTCAI
jgi:hypothetical protein